jgi:hypothetical protein
MGAKRSAVKNWKLAEIFGRGWGRREGKRQEARGKRGRGEAVKQ